MSAPTTPVTTPTKAPSRKEKNAPSSSGDSGERRARRRARDPKADPATATPAEPAAEWVALAELVPWAKNPRVNDATIPLLVDSIVRFGFGAPLVARSANREIIAGHTRIKAAASLPKRWKGATSEERKGWSKDATALATSARPVLPVRYLDLDENEAHALALADNKIPETSSWDDGGLARVLTDLAQHEVNLDGLGWSDAELRDVIAGAADAPPADPRSPTGHDILPPAPAIPDSQPGCLYRLGRHVLVCGDGTTPGVWEESLAGRQPTMVWTDPPYGMGLQTDYTKVGHGEGRRYDPVIGDDRPFDPAPFLAALGHDVAEQFWWGADYYHARLPPGGSWLVWDKRTSGDGAAYDDLFGASFELCWTRAAHKREMIRILWAMSHGREGEDVRWVHPTQKPVALARWFLDRFTIPGDVVVDGYGGSGTLLMAAELSGRAVVLTEITPTYCDVIRLRWTTYARANNLDPGPGALEPE